MLVLVFGAGSVTPAATPAGVAPVTAPVTFDLPYALAFARPPPGGDANYFAPHTGPPATTVAAVHVY